MPSSGNSSLVSKKVCHESFRQGLCQRGCLVVECGVQGLWPARSETLSWNQDKSDESLR